MGHATRRILVADDHYAMRCGIRSLLESQSQYRVIAEAGDGREAWRLAQELKPDIAIIDFSMPLMNGLDLTRSLKQDLPNTEVLIYTMHDQESILVDILRAGARGYVLKSDAASHLLAAVSALAKHQPYFSGEMHQIMMDHFVNNVRREDKGVSLTSRERQVIRLIAEGKINKQAAYILSVALKTVETHRASAMRKLRISTTAELVVYAIRNNIIEP
jgi:DNA-binding NarL/FixJ family response regulator